MLWKKYRLTIILIPIVCLIIYFCIYHFLFSICLSLIIIGLIYGIIFALHSSKAYTIDTNRKIKNKSNDFIYWFMEQIQSPKNEQPKTMVIEKHDSHISVDVMIDHICDLFLRDIILPWYKEISSEQATFTEALKEEVRILVANVRQRCKQLDWVEIISKDIVNLFSGHYQQIRQHMLNPRNCPYTLPSYLVNDEEENKFLRLLSESILYLLLPTSYSSNKTIRHLLREIFVFKVFKPTFELISEPDYFNENIIYQIDQFISNHEQKIRKFTLASNYENFIKLIETSNDVDKLEHFWTYIVTEIMQATAIRNLLKEGIISKENQQNRLGTKGELLINRDLTKYLNQLRRAKIVCERCLTAKGGRSYLLFDASTNKTNIANRKILALNIILSSIKGRTYFHQFLETFGTGALINFWYDIWKLRSALPDQQHRVATNIYKVYITSFGSAIVDEIDNEIINRMKSFLVAELPLPDSFYEAQKIIYNVLQRDYYASFLVSKQYDALCRVFNSGDLHDFDLKEQLFGWSSSTSTEEDFDEKSTSSQIPESPNDEQAQSVPKRLADLRSQLTIKRNALAALREASTFDKKVISALERDCADINQEISALECSLENVDVWWTHLGHWQCQVLPDIENGHLCVAVLIRSPSNDFGWVVTRTLRAWQHFYFRLKELKPVFPTIDLFRTRHQTFSSKQLNKLNSQQFYEQLQTFLQSVLHDEEISKFELVYQFINPSSIDNDTSQPTNLLSTRKKATNISKLFSWDKTVPDLLEIENSTRHQEGRDDSIANPFYNFLDLLFDERGLLKLIRMTLVQFIRVTYGSTINRQVRRSVVSLFQEEYLVKYLTILQDAIWPKIPRVSRPFPTEEEKHERQQQAKQQLLTNIPETLSLIFGSDNARIGIERLFELFQDARLNKHLFYKLILLIMEKIFPELKLCNSN